jgi:hypothetical protein
MRLVFAIVLVCSAPAHAGVDPFAPVAIAGPFTSIEAFCKASLSVYTDPDVRAILEPRCEDSIEVISAPTVGPPYDELRIVQIPETSEGLVAVKVGGAWYLQAVDPIEAPPNCHGPLAITQVTERPKHALQISFEIEGHCERRDHEWAWRERGFVVVGMGASQLPTMTPPFRLAITETDETEGRPRRQTLGLTRKVTWRRDGSLDITKARGARAWFSAPEPAGHHPLAFP